MDDEQVLDQRFVAWLHEGPTTASNWVSRAAIDHARDHPRRAPVGVRWGSVLKDLVAGRPAVISRRLAIALAAATLLLALAGVGYLAWRQNVVVPPLPLPSPSPTTSAVQFECPPGTNPDEPGPADQLRPQPDIEWRAAVDADSGVMVVASGHEIWLFDLCTNTWRRSAATTTDGRVPVYDPNADLIVMLGSERVTTFDAERAVATQLGETPVVGQWEAVYDPVDKVIVARDEGSSRMWAYRVGDDEWRELAQAGDLPPAADAVSPTPDGDRPCDIQLMSYDLAAQRLVLMRDPSWCSIPGAIAQTFEFDLGRGTWQQLSVATPASAVFDWSGPRMQIAYDLANQLSVMFDGRNMNGFDGIAGTWKAVFHRQDINAADGGLTHHRVPLAYDPINRRVVMLGGDPLARSDPAHANLGREQFQDVSAVDLATLTWTELLAGQSATPSPTPVVERANDAVGDAPSASDIVLVTTSVVDGLLTLEVTLAGDWSSNIQGSYLLSVNWASRWNASCNPWIATYRSFVAPDGTVSGSLPLLVGQKAQIMGPTLRLTAPLEAFGDPTTLGLSVATPGERGNWAAGDGDSFPDPGEAPDCHYIPLSPAAGP